MALSARPLTRLQDAAAGCRWRLQLAMRRRPCNIWLDPGKLLPIEFNDGLTNKIGNIIAGLIFDMGAVSRSTLRIAVEKVHNILDAAGMDFYVCGLALFPVQPLYGLGLYVLR